VTRWDERVVSLSWLLGSWVCCFSTFNGIVEYTGRCRKQCEKYERVWEFAGRSRVWEGGELILRHVYKRPYPAIIMDFRYQHGTEVYVVRACYNDDATGECSACISQTVLTCVAQTWWL
jgi:hypothetical protein